MGRARSGRVHQAGRESACAIRQAVGQRLFHGVHLARLRRALPRPHVRCPQTSVTDERKNIREPRLSLNLLQVLPRARPAPGVVLPV